MRKRRAICPLTVAYQQCLTSLSVPPITPQPPPGHLPWHHLKGLGGTTQRSQALVPLPSRRFSRGLKATPTSMQGSSETSSGKSEATPHNAPSLPRSRGGLCPQGPCKASFEQTNTSTWSSYMSSSTAWPSPWKGEVILIICNTSSLKNAKWQPQQGCPQSCNSHLQPHQTGISRIGDKSESRSPAAMGTDAQPGGSNTWTKGEWLGTPRGIPLVTSQSSSVSMPWLILEELTRHPGDSRHGSSLHLQDPPPRSLCSVEGSMHSLRTTGDMWQKSTASAPSTSSAGRPTPH
jgi:hypothetical protein